MTPLLEKLIDVLATVWIAGLWQGALFVLLGAVVIRLLPHAAAAFRHGVLIAFFALTLGLPWLSFHHGTDAGHALRIAPWVAIGIAGCWAVGMCFRAVTLMVAWQHLRSVRRSALPLPVELKDILGLQLAGRPLPVVCSSAAVDSPLIVGFFRPVLLLPEWLAPTLNEEEFRQIVLHEFEHLRRGDDWSNLWLHIGLTLFPLNPALLWFNRRIGVQRELACDAAVVAATARPIDYAASLARIAEKRLRRNTLRLALAAWGRQSELSHRVHALLEQPKGWSPRQRTLATASMAIVVVASVLGLAHVPQLVQVGAPAVAMASVSKNSLRLPEHFAAVSTEPANAGAFKFVATSYHVESAPRRHRTTVRRTSQNRELQMQQPVYAYAVAEMAERPTLHRTNGTEAEVRDLLTEAQADGPERVVPVRFSPTYLAVAVPSGWILIQL
jgi:beta-lactamase regulating signal transducer with metallopeptidase domain